MNKNSIIFKLLLCVALFAGCDAVKEDIIPDTFQEFRLYPDDIYGFNSPDEPNLLRLDPLQNDSIKIEVTVSFSDPKNGILTIEEDGDTYYSPNDDFWGVDSLTYKVCSKKMCKEEKIRLHIEKPEDPNSCTTKVVNDFAETTMNQYVDIRIFMNDEICGIPDLSYFQPEKGKYDNISYSGSLKSYVFRYYPPQDYTGQDTFKYRVYIKYPFEYIEGVVTITIK